jgi:SpoVK/Ycf46/Vps4 family AAA+-type ATPase
LSASLSLSHAHKHTHTHTLGIKQELPYFKSYDDSKIKIFLFDFFFSTEGQLLDVVSQRTAGFLFSDLRELVQKSILQNYRRVRQQNSSVYDVFSTSFKLDFDDFETSLKDFEDILADSIGAPKVPNVTWQDVGKLNGVRLIVMAPFLLQWLYF